MVPRAHIQLSSGFPKTKSLRLILGSNKFSNMLRLALVLILIVIGAFFTTTGAILWTAILHR